MRHFAAFLVWGSIASGACACAHVEYRPETVSAGGLLAQTEALPTGPLSFEAAVRWAVEHAPDLRALRAQAAAVNLRPPPEPLEAEAGVDSDGRPEAVLTLDATSLLGYGTRPAERILARARHRETWMRHHERAWEVAAAIAEAFEVERALRALAPPDVTLDAQAYVRAGLESVVAETAVATTKAEIENEMARIASERARNRFALLRLLGAPPDGAVELDLPPAPFPRVEDSTVPALLATRADLQRGLAAYETADSDLRRAIAAQYPSLVLSPGLAFDPAWLFGHVGLRIPVGAGPAAIAAEAARDSAREDLRGLVLDALQQAASSREESALAQRRLAVARRRAATNLDLFRSAKARLEAVGGSFVEVAFAADALVSAWRDVDEAEVEAARARVRAARAQGWPRPAGGTP